MASQSATAEGASVVTADQINYQQKMFSHPNYRFEPQFANTFGQPIVLGASQTPVTINIPPEVINLSQSYLLYSVNLPTSKQLHLVRPTSVKRNFAHPILLWFESVDCRS